MNKKEILEIRKQFHPNRSTIKTICGCYVNNEGHKILTKKVAFAGLSEEEQAKYFGIFKKALSGKLEKNLININFENKNEQDGGTQSLLMSLRKSELQDDALLEEFYDKVIESYSFSGNYYITLINSSYDIPSVSGNGEMLDVSSDVFNFIVCAICPVTLTKPALVYNKKNNNIEDGIRDWIVDAPLHGILFPAYNERNTDIHAALYYTKKDKDIQLNFVDCLLGVDIPMSAKLQNEAYVNILEKTLDNNYTFEVHQNIQEHIAQQQLTAESNNETEPLALSKNDLRCLLEKSGVSDAALNNFNSVYDKEMGQYKNGSLKVENIIDTAKSVIKTAEISINVKSESANLVKVKTIDGKRCIVIEANNDVLINGVSTSL